MTKIAVIGAGYWGRNLIRNFVELGTLQAICDVDPKRLNDFKHKYPHIKATFSFSEILDDKSIDAVVISTPAKSHYELAKEALKSGKHCFVEKPLALHVEEGIELTELAEAIQKKLMVGHLLEYHPAINKLKEVIDAGELGKIHYIYSNRLNLGKVRKEENILWSFAPHDISVILLLLEEMPTEITALGGSYLNHQIADITISTLSFPSGVKAHIFVSWLHPYKEQRLVVVGDRKMAEFNDVVKDGKLRIHNCRIDWIKRTPTPHNDGGIPVPYDEYEPLKVECKHFLKCIEHDLTPKTDGNSGVRVLRLLNSLQESLKKEGQPIPIKEKKKRGFFIHPTSQVDEGCEIGKGTKVWHFSHILKCSKIGRECTLGQNVVIGPHVTIGNNVKIQNNVSVYQGVTLEDEVFCGPSMVFTNVFNPRSSIPRMEEMRKTLVKKGATIGANATIICGNTIGKYALIGAWSVVTQSVPDYALIIGNPGKLSGWICKCGTKLTFNTNRATCEACGEKYRKKNGEVSEISKKYKARLKTTEITEANGIKRVSL